MIRLQIQLTEAQAATLKRLAAARGVSMAAMIREAVERIATDRDVGRRWDRALSAVGSFSSGRTDVSAEHDAHLADAFAR